MVDCRRKLGCWIRFRLHRLLASGRIQAGWLDEGIAAIIARNFQLSVFPMRARSVSTYLFCATLFCLSTALAVAEEPSVADVLQSPAESAPTEKESAAPVETQEPVAPPEAMRKTEKFGRDTPHSSVHRFLKAVDDNDYETAAEYLDFRNLPKTMDVHKGRVYAQQLEVILDRGLWVNVDALSPEPEGFSDDGLPSYRDLIGTVDLHGENVDILLQRVPGDENDRVWKFSNTTVANIPRLHEVYGYGQFGEWLSGHLPDRSFLGLLTWQWVLLIGLLAAGYSVTYLGTWPVFYLLRRRESGLGSRAVLLIAAPLRLLITLLITKQWFYVVRPSVEARAVAEANTLMTIVILWFTFRLIDLIRVHYTATMEARGRDYVTVLLRPAATAAKIVITIIALMTWIENLGFKATTLIAGLGVGGLAVALAAQKSIENLIGAITLYLSAPVKVGDLCRFGDQQGVIEEINLRATRIRTLDRTLIAVPNSIFAEMNLENLSVREKIRYEPHLCLSHAATAEQVRTVLQGIRAELAQHPDIDQENLYVRFNDFGERGLNLKSLIYVTTQDYQQFLGVAEELNLRIMDIAAAAGTELAEPLRGAHESSS